MFQKVDSHQYIVLLFKINFLQTNFTTMQTDEKHYREMSQKLMNAIKNNNDSIEGLHVRWTSAKHRMQLEGTIFHYTQSRKTGGLMLHIEPDNQHIDNMKVPFSLIRSILTK